MTFYALFIFQTYIFCQVKCFELINKLTTFKCPCFYEELRNSLTADLEGFHPAKNTNLIRINRGLYILI